MGKEIEITVGPSAKRAEELHKQKMKKRAAKAAATRKRNRQLLKRQCDAKRKEQKLLMKKGLS